MGINTTILFVASLLLVLVMAKLVRVFYEKRRTSLKVMFLSFLSAYFILLVQQLLASYHPGLMMVLEFPVIFVGCIILTLNYKSTIARRLVAAFFSFLIVVFSVMLIGNAVFFLFPNLQIGGAAWVVVTYITLIPIGFLAATLINRFKRIKKKTAFPKIALIAPLSTALILLVGFAYMIAYIFGIGIAEEVGMTFALLVFAWLIFSNFFLFDILSAKYEEKLKSEQQAQEKEYYYTQCQLMQESAEQVKAIRHDIKIHLATLKGFTTNGNMEDIKGYLDRLVDDIEKSEVYSNTGNIAFDSIINHKLRNAKNDGIKLDLNVAVPPEIQIEVADIVTVLGNLLDNALEAVAKANEKIIKLDIKLSKGGLFVKIENSFNGEVKYGEQGRGESAIVSLKGDTQHGYGLKNIGQVIEKYNGHMKIAHSEGVFSVGVLLYVDDT